MRDGSCREAIETQPWAILDVAATGATMTAASKQLHEQTGRTAGNGSLMRTAPVALPYVHRLSTPRIPWSISAIRCAGTLPTA